MTRRGIPEISLDTADDVNMICRQKTCNLHMAEQLTMVVVVLSSQDKGASLGEGPWLPMDDA